MLFQLQYFKKENQIDKWKERMVNACNMHQVSTCEIVVQNLMDLIYPFVSADKPDILEWQVFYTIQLAQ